MCKTDVCPRGCEENQKTHHIWADQKISHKKQTELWKQISKEKKIYLTTKFMINKYYEFLT
jgi:hypothetical protein